MAQQNRIEKEPKYKLVNPIGEIIMRGTHTDCWIKLLKIQPHSAHYATAYDGWQLACDHEGKGYRCESETCVRVSIYNDRHEKLECMGDKN